MTRYSRLCEHQRTRSKCPECVFLQFRVLETGRFITSGYVSKEFIKNWEGTAKRLDVSMDQTIHYAILEYVHKIWLQMKEETQMEEESAEQGT